MNYLTFSIFFIPAMLFANAIERVNVSQTLRQETERRYGPGQFDYVSSNYNAISADGRYVVYSSNSTRLVPNDTNGIQDTFFYDRKTGAVERISVTELGQQAVGGQYASTSATDLSDDGRYVLMHTSTTNLVPGGGNGNSQVILKDRRTGAIELISKNLTGGPVAEGASAAALSPDARYVLFGSPDGDIVAGDTNNESDLFLFDRQSQTMERVSLSHADAEINGFTGGGDMSDDGRYIVFLSRGTNFGDDNNGNDMQAYLRDRTTGTVSLITTALDGGVADQWSGWLHISGDGNYITFATPSTNLVANDTNRIVNIVNAGTEQEFTQTIVDGTDVFHIARTDVGTAGNLNRISVANDTTQANRGSYEPEISQSGRYVVFFSDATNLIASGDANGTKSDILYVDTVNNTIERLNHGVDGIQGNDQATNCTLNANGQVILFHSLASSLVPGDTNKEAGTAFSGQDVFVVQRQQPPAATITDTDSDGLDDDWEIQYFGDLRFLASDDPDGDGQDNAAEHTALTNPFGIELNLRRGWNVVSLPHAMKHRHYSEFFMPAVRKATTWNARRQDDAPAFDLPGDQGIWLYDAQPTAQRIVPIALP